MRKLRGLLAGGILFVCAGQAAGAGQVPSGPMTPERLLDLGLPREAMKRLAALPAPGRWRDPALPRLLRALAGAGEEEAALGLFSEARPQLVEPVRSAAFLEAGKIRWRRKESGTAVELFRQVRPGSPEAAEAAVYLARHAAAGGDPVGALRALGPAEDGPLKRLLAGEIEALRGRPDAARSEWGASAAGTPAGSAARRLYLLQGPDRAAAARELRAMADAALERPPESIEALSALATTRLLSGERAGALDAAREGIAGIGRWRASLAGLPPWDGTFPGAEASLSSTSSLFPYGEDASRAASLGRRFLSLAALGRTLAESEERSLALERDTRRLRAAVLSRKTAFSVTLDRVKQVEARFRDDVRRAGTVPRRLLQAADDLPLSEWGERTDPQLAALLDEAAEKLSILSAAAERIRSVTQAMAGWEDTRALPPEDQRMVFFALDRLAKAGETLASLEARETMLRSRVWNRWKSAYVRRLAPHFDAAGRARRRAEEQAARAGRAAAFLQGSIEDLASWDAALSGMGTRMTRDAEALRSRREEVRRLAAEALREARGTVLPGIARKERALHRIAGRAAAEWYLEGKTVPVGDNAALPPGGLLPDAIRHLEASLPPPGERVPFSDESLYALAALRFEESSLRFYRGGEGERGDAQDLSVPILLFRRILDEYPDSPYGEDSLYGLSLCLQEAGAPDNAASALETLLSRYPATRRADEVNLRLGEHRFDRYDFPGAEAAYRRVRDAAGAEIATTARFKLGWSLFLQGRPREAAEKFLEAAVLSPGASKTGGLREEARRMTARSLVEAGGEGDAEAFLQRRGGGAEGPAVLLAVERFLEAQNRYEEAARTASRLGAAYPLSSERLPAEEEAVSALRKARKDDESMARRGAYHLLFGPGTPWRSAPGRTAEEIARADSLSMEGLAAAGFHFHAAARGTPPGDRSRVLSLYDAFLSLFPSSAKAEEVSYQRAWLLFEDGRKREALPSFEAVARRPSGARGEAAGYMAVQCAKDLSSPGDLVSQGEIVRTAREYERAFPSADRGHLVLLDRARAHFHRKEWSDAVDAATAAGRKSSAPEERRAAYRLAGEAGFESGRYEESERAFREVLAASPPEREREEAEKWTGFSMFKAAERLPSDRSAEGGALFLRIAREFPALPIVPEARFRAGASYAEAGKVDEAIGAYLSVETLHSASPLAIDATRRLAALYERNGQPLPAAERLERLSGTETGGERKGGLLFRSAELYSRGKDEARSRRAYLAASALPDAPPALRILSLFRAGESARAEGKEDEADGRYDDAVKLHREKGGAAPEIAGRALYLRAEARFRSYLPMRIAPPLEKTYAEKQQALERCVELYAEAVRIGDAGTASSSLYRIGEGLEDFRAAILASPPPPELTSTEKEEYLFLLEERAAPIEERAVESYRNGLRHAVAADHFDPWVAKSRERLRALRPALFGKRAEFAFPVLPVPDFLGITERVTP